MLDILTSALTRALCTPTNNRVDGIALARTSTEDSQIIVDDRGRYGVELRDQSNPAAWISYQSGATSPIPNQDEPQSMATTDKDPVQSTTHPRFNPEHMEPQDLAIILHQLHEQASDHQAILDIAEARDTLDQFDGTQAFKVGPVRDALQRVQSAQAAASTEEVRLDLRGVSDALTSILNELVSRGGPA